MRRPMQALAWHFWAINRRGWTITLGTIAICAVTAQFISESARHHDVTHVLGSMAMIFSMLVMLAFCDFTDRDPRGGFAGFPRRLFLLPIRTALLVLWPMLCAVVAVVGVFVAWSMLVIRPLGEPIEIGWPAMLLGTTIVLYQTIIWCLSGFRIARIVVMSLAASVLTSVACMPWVLASSNWPPVLIQRVLGGALILTSICSYVGAVIAVGAQRRGGARGWNFPASLSRAISFATSPLNRRELKPFASPQRALFWMEWRRNGRILPAIIVLVLLLIIGPVSALNGHGADATAWTALWVFLMPILLAAIIGKGVAKPDLWTLDLAMPTFSATRPITPGEIVAAKLKSAAYSTLLTWMIPLLVVPFWIGVAGNLHTLNEFGQFGRQLYTPAMLTLISALMVLTGMLLTFGFMVNAFWIGLSGQTERFYAIVCASVVVFITAIILIGTTIADADSSAIFVARVLPWLPWVFAGLVLVKIWLAVWTLAQAFQRRVASMRMIVAYLALWVSATGLLIVLAWLISPQILWLRNSLMLGAMLALPLARIGAAPLALARNLHR